MKSFAFLCVTLCAICAEAAAITTDAPGWLFRDNEKPTFCINGAPGGRALPGGANLRAARFLLRDWRGRELASGERSAREQRKRIDRNAVPFQLEMQVFPGCAPGLAHPSEKRARLHPVARTDAQ